MLFIETPYGVYEIMDWVAQAQLCSSVGPNAMTTMWRLRVSTLFDLERLAMDPRREFGSVTGYRGASCEGSPVGSASVSFSNDAVRASMQMRLDDPYVHPLRQIYSKAAIATGDSSGCRRG